MKNKAINIKVMIQQNLKYKSVRSIGLAILLMIIAFLIFFSSMMSFGLSNGLDSTEKRLGADILVVPKDSESDLSGFLLKGKPSTYYLERSLVEKITNTSGVEKVTTQIDVGTLDAACCTSSIQLIGLDTATDFVVTPWISEVYDITKLKDDEIIIGNSISGQSGSTLKFFDQNFKVVAKLTRTGMGYDTTTFMNQATARKMAKLRAEKLDEASTIDYHQVVSTILIEVQADTTPFIVAKRLSLNLSDENISVVKSENIIENTSQNLGNILKFIRLLTGLIVGFSLLIIVILIMIMINERRKEFAIYRMLGMSKKHLLKIVIGELSVLSIFGIIAGITSGSLIFYLFNQLIQQKIETPFLIPTTAQLNQSIMLTIFSILLIMIVSSIYSLIRINRLEVSTLIREES